MHRQTKATNSRVSVNAPVHVDGCTCKSPYPEITALKQVTELEE